MYDLVIRNGRICDGTGAPAFDGDVAIAGDRIVAVGTLDDGQIGAETETIDEVERLIAFLPKLQCFRFSLCLRIAHTILLFC